MCSTGWVAEEGVAISKGKWQRFIDFCRELMRVGCLRVIRHTQASARSQPSMNAAQINKIPLRLSVLPNLIAIKRILKPASLAARTINSINPKIAKIQFIFHFRSVSSSNIAHFDTHAVCFGIPPSELGAQILVYIRLPFYGSHPRSLSLSCFFFL